MKSFFLFTVLAALAACNGKPAADPSPPVATHPASDSTDAAPECGPENSLGGMCMSSGGKSLWPPSGPGCERVVSCCRAMSSDTSPAARCLLASVAYPDDCTAMLKTIAAMAKEHGEDVSAACETPSDE